MSTFNKRTFISIVIFLLCLLVLFFSWWLYKKSDLSIPEITFPITFSPKWVNQAQFAGVFVAKENNFYRDVGLDVAINQFEMGDSVMNDLETGVSDLGLMSANEFLINYSKGKPIKALAAFYQASPFVVASLKYSNITSPAEFVGKNLGIKGGTGAESQIVFELLLKSANIKPTEVNFIDLPLGPLEKDDLIEQRADVVGFYRTRLYQFEKEGLQYELIYPEQYGATLYNDVLVTTDEFLANHPDEIKAFIKATLLGWDYTYKHKEEAIADTLKYVTVKEYLDPDYERYILNESEPLMDPFEDNNIGQMDLGHWKRFYDVLLDKKNITIPFDVALSFTTEYLP